jgi:serine/threonine-protein kinase
MVGAYHGSLVANRYRLQGRTTTGATGEVWRAFDLTLGRPVALRLLRCEHAADAGGFLAAAGRAARLRHPGVVRVYDYGRFGAEGIPYLVTEPAGATSLATVMKTGPLEPAWVLSMIREVASALDAAHTLGLVHQHINPRNLLLAPGGAVKLTDFGSPHAAEPHVCASGDPPGYAAPERTPGAPATPASDLYSLGAVAWECLAGKSLPTRLEGGGRQVPRLPAAIGAGAAALIADLTATDPAARSASARRVADRAGEVLAVPMRASEGNGAASVLLDPEGHGSGPLLDQPGARPSTRVGARPSAQAGERASARADARPGPDQAAVRGNDLYQVRAG